MYSLFNYNPHKKTILLRLKIKAASKMNRIDGFTFNGDQAYLKMTVRTIPEHGKANEAIINFLADAWKIKKICFQIISGHKNSLKLIEIKNIDLEYLNSILSSYI